MSRTGFQFSKRKGGNINEGLIGYFKLNEATAGPVINEVGANATNYGAQIKQPGAFGTSYNFNGNSRVEMPPMLAGLTEFSISWYANLYQVVWPENFFGAWSGVNAWYMRLNNGKYEASIVTDQEGRNDWGFEGLPTQDAWQHHCLRWKTGEYPTLHVGKVELTNNNSQVTKSGTIKTGATELIGALLTGNTHSLRGRMDEIRFYNKKISTKIINLL